MILFRVGFLKTILELFCKANLGLIATVASSMLMQKKKLSGQKNDML